MNRTFPASSPDGRLRVPSHNVGSFAFCVRSSGAHVPWKLLPDLPVYSTQTSCTPAEPSAAVFTLKWIALPSSTPEAPRMTGAALTPAALVSALPAPVQLADR